MATYEYRCVRHREFTVSFPIGEAAADAACPVCGVEAVRVFSAPAFARTPGRLAAAMDKAAASAESPEVVSGIPNRHRPRQPVNPAHARLPRP